jgi:endo-1,4-beta-xylanase
MSTSMPPSRREFLSSAAAAAAWSTLSGAPAVALPTRRRAGFGAAVTSDDLRADARLAEAVKTYCTQIAPVYELKWAPLRPARDVFTFTPADALVDFAEHNALKMRGHNLVWYYGMPDWTREISSPREAERELTHHIETVVSRYRSRMVSWDVVNEPIPDNPRSDADRRETLWTHFLGQSYADIAFRAAAAADPGARLVVNEYDVEFAESASRIKRAALRRFALERLDAGAPLHAIGLQCHLRGDKLIDRDGVTKFVEEMRGEGLDIYVTELDVQDQYLPSPAAERDAIIARAVTDILAAISAPAPIDTLLTWGLSDRYSWISQMFPRADHTPNRPLPLDSEFQPKPFMAAIEKFTRPLA